VAATEKPPLGFKPRMPHWLDESNATIVEVVIPLDIHRKKRDEAALLSYLGSLMSF